ncbi:hypothetical protein TW74_05955 [Vibrio nigripulchritudo]|nr:hypothetical protein TW74_05955 [Vibrio nigripulchritudo]
MDTHSNLTETNVNQTINPPLKEEDPPFRWLLNDYTAKTWHLKPQIESDEPSKYRINWFGGAVGQKSGWGYWVDILKDAASAKMGRTGKPKITTSTLVSYSRNLRLMFRFLFLDRNCSVMGDVTVDDIEALKTMLIRRDITCSSLESYAIALHDCYLLRKKLKKPLGFNPFPSTTKTQWANANGKPDGHTPTLVPRETFFLLNEAIKRVNSSKKDLALLKTYMKIRGSELSNPANYFKNQTGKSSGVLIKRIRELYGAALVVTFLLTAERKHEASLREEGDVIDLLESELDVLYGLEKKTSGSTSGKRTEVAVIKEVKDAFKVIMEITQYTRDKTGLSKVLLKIPMAHCASGKNQKHYYLTNSPLYSLLEYFAKSCGFDLKLRPHMFRRAYSMIWSWRYEVGDLDELSKMLKHNNKIFTERYTDDEDIWHFMPETHQKMAFDILNNALTQKVQVAGGASKTLERYGRIIQAKSRLLNPTEIANFIDGLLSEGEIKIIPHAEGYCVITKETKGESRCLGDDGEMKEERREETRCAGCPNLGIDDKRKAFWEKRIELHQKVIDGSSKPELVESSKQFIMDAKAALSNSAF